MFSQRLYTKKRRDGLCNKDFFFFFISFKYKYAIAQHAFAFVSLFHIFFFYKYIRHMKHHIISIKVNKHLNNRINECILCGIFSFPFINPLPFLKN